LSEFSGAFPAPTWTPPAREPFVPLRPLTLGQILAGAFRALRHNPAVTLGPAILFSLIASLGATAISWGLVDPLVSVLGSSTATAYEFYDWFASFGAGLVSWVVAQSLVLAVGVLQQAVSAVDVSHAVLGRRITAGGLRRRTRGLRVQVVLWSLVVLVAAVAGGITGAAVIAVAAVADPLIGTLTGFGVFAVGLVLLVWLGTRLAFVPSAIVVERIPFWRAVGRSRRLTRGYFWLTFGIRLLCWGMIWFATLLVGIPVQLLTSWFTGILAGNGDAGDSLALNTIGMVAAAVVGAVIAAIGLVITTAADAILYLDLRMRHEGLDLELARFMERRRPSTRFDPTEHDPYRFVAPIAAGQPAAPGQPAGPGGAGLTGQESPWA